MSTTVPELTYEATATIAEFIYEHPGKTMTEILEGLEGKVTRMDFNMAEDVLIDRDIIYGDWRRVEKGGWVRTYVPGTEHPVDYVKERLKERFNMLPSDQ